MNARSFSSVFIFMLVIAAGGLEAQPSHQEVSLEQGFRREFAYLKAQIKQLEARKFALKSKLEEQDKNFGQILGDLQNERLRRQADEFRQAQELKNLEKIAGSLEEQQDLLRVTLQNVAQEKNLSLDLSEAQEFGALSAKLFAEEIQALIESSRLQLTSTEFFLLSGELVSGQVLSLGKHMAFGWSENASGPLALTGSGQWQLMRAESASVPATQLQESSTISEPSSGSPRLAFYLSDGVNDEKILKQNSKSPLQVIQSGGQIAWVIVVLGLVSLILIGLRTWRLRQCIRKEPQKVREFVLALRGRELLQAQQIQQSTKGSLYRLLQLFSTPSLEHADLEERVLFFLSEEESRMNQYGQAILVFASVAPLLGLLGTVTGMIGTFEIITELGTGNPKMLSGGIGEALITTELGLIVAIPTLLFGHFLSQWAQGWREELERTGSTLLLAFAGANKIEFQSANNLAQNRGESFSAAKQASSATDYASELLSPQALKSLPKKSGPEAEI